MFKHRVSSSQISAACRKHGYNLSPCWNFASRNTRTDTYWSEPKVRNLQHDWDFVLNDTKNNQLLILRIPAGKLSESMLSHRNAEKLSVDLDPDTLRDKRSTVSFAGFLVKTIPFAA
ncbi:hypothetical protein HDR66_02315 [bacterium]|nr:hypothetical protein [bacterium]